MVDPRQVLAGFLTLSMFVMLGNMIKHDHFTSVSELAVDATGVELNAMKIADNTEITKAGVELEATEEIKPCWTKPSPKDDQSNGFVTLSLTIGPEYHASQIADAVVIARYLGATLVLPEIRGNELGKSRKFQDMYDVEKFKMNLDGVVKVVDKLPAELTTKKPAVIRVPNRVTEDFILDTIQPAFQKNSYLRLAIIFSSMLGRLKELSKKSDGRVLAVDMRTDLLEKKTCKTSAGARRKGCYNPQEVLNFLKKVGFSANTTIYLTETWWHKGLNNLKRAFPHTYTKDDIMPAEKKGEFLNSGDSDLARALDLEVCSQTDVFVPAIPGMFYGNVAGKRIAAGLTQILVPAPVVGGSAQASDFVSTYITKKSHFAYSCYC
ncbi:unnamed protein product [Triticum turgidum subsp. durum]|uniref:O-fucosyltransferase family protein n=1 Tax=Triticum turgidum subsp. durum TaxID=4567 RepID=A0A9R0TSZ3_TRITD|nr:unnamed protein product [Triticum turgidum subsp. durum]